jgi:selenide, water dikinase
VGPGDLEKILSGLPEETAPELLSSLRSGEDAGVYLISEGLAIVQTVDFFPPIVDDPYTFGQITAANALSDVYAMGARPVTALNIAAFPCGMDLGVLEQILLGGQDKIHQAGAVIVGGHTIDDDELKYGLAVTGLVDPAKMTTISGARPGDVLLLTKPLGTGILATALKGGILDEDEIREAVESMCTLNRDAADVLSRYQVNACTDVTGFGLAGHLYEMAGAGGVPVELWAHDVPLFERTLEMASMGIVPEATKHNIEHVGSIELPGGEDDELLTDCLYDPQTSGGLLASVDASDAGPALEELRNGPSPRAAMVGKVLEKPRGTGRITYGRSR